MLNCKNLLSNEDLLCWWSFFVIINFFSLRNTFKLAFKRPKIVYFQKPGRNSENLQEISLKPVATLLVV